MESQNCQNNKRMIIHRILHSEAVSRKVVHVVRSTMLTPLQNRTNQPPVSGHQVGGDPWMLKLGPQKLCTGFVLHLLPFSVELCTHHQNDNAIRIPGHSPGVSWSCRWFEVTLFCLRKPIINDLRWLCFVFCLYDVYKLRLGCVAGTAYRSRQRKLVRECMLVLCPAGDQQSIASQQRHRISE